MDQQTLDRVVSPDLVSLSPPPDEKRAAIEHLLDIAVEAGRVTDREAALDALLEREADTSTGVGMGIGIPHAKTDGVTGPTVVFSRSPAGIDFGAPDGEPATLLFMILVPESGSDDHLSILSSLSRALMDDDVRAQLHDATSPQDVTDTLYKAIA